MRNAQDRIAKLGIIGLAGIAILGWVRQPETHHQLQAAPRAVFQAPLEIPETRNILEHPAATQQDAEESRVPVRRSLMKKRATVLEEPIVPEPANRGRVKEVARAEDSRHESGILTPQPEQARSSDPHSGVVTEPAAATRDRQAAAQARPPEDLGNIGATGTPKPAAPNATRSRSRSIAIIAGAAAAGAAIGGIAGHGKGAAIGAAVGVTSGYVYDRASRRRNGSPANNSNHQDRQNDQSDATSVTQVRRFGTPYFN